MIIAILLLAFAARCAYGIICWWVGGSSEKELMIERPYIEISQTETKDGKTVVKKIRRST